MMEVVTSVQNCARCDGDHKSLSFKEMRSPIECGSVDLTHWAVCPVTGDPVLLRIIEEEGK